jgi:hypothetical protein
MPRSPYQNLRIVVIRPYRVSLRVRVFERLAEAGSNLELATTIPAETPDDEVVDLLQTTPADMLVVPFHAHRDRLGRRVNGVELLPRLRAGRHVTTRVVAPVSRVGMVAAELLTSRLGDVLGPTLFLPEDRLDDSEILGALEAFLSAKS